VTKPEPVEVKENNTHSTHYEALEPHEPIDVYATWVNANPIFKEMPELAGYYLNIIKYIARIDMKKGEDALTNLHKSRYYIEKMINNITIDRNRKAPW